MTIPVMEIYEACQGEGVRVGEPSLFVRTFGCNLRCSWCDTAYSINPREWAESGHEGDPYQDYTVEVLADAILGRRPRAVVLTGGEPLIHDGLIHVVRKVEPHCHVTVETNATLLPKPLLQWMDPHEQLNSRMPDVLWSLSPKMNSADTGGRAWVDYSVVQWFIDYASCQLKFVIASRRDLDQAAQMLRALEWEDTYNWHVPVVFQPNGSVIREGTFMYLEALKQLQDWVTEEFRNDKEWKVFVIPQVHVLVHGQQRLV